MMLSVEQPDLCREVLQYPGGIHSIRLTGENIPRVILKLPVSFILPAKVNKGFKVYVEPVEVLGRATLGVMCAFFDDADSPLVFWRLLDDSEQTMDLVHALTRKEVLVHLFDDQNRELLGYRAHVSAPLMAKIRLEHASFVELTHEGVNEAHEGAMQWFSLRTKADDEEAIQVKFVEPLFPEDQVFIDARPDLYQFQGGPGVGHTALVREEPGSFQELDIILALQKVFKPEQIYHAPLRYYDKEEIADVLVITDSTCLIVQAKDSPNTEQTLNRTLERKRKTSLKMVQAACRQLSGAVNYMDRTRPLRMIVDGNEVVIEMGRRNVLSLAVVREMFLDMYADYSKELFGFLDKEGLPCMALDYSELHQYTSFCRDESAFLNAYFQVFDKAREVGVFPRLRFGLRDAEELMRSRE